MPFGKTIEMITRTRATRWRSEKPREATPRDRSLRGKARIKARKEANKAPAAPR
jgi:hypothetical protein